MAKPKRNPNDVVRETVIRFLEFRDGRIMAVSPWSEHTWASRDEFRKQYDQFNLPKVVDEGLFAPPDLPGLYDTSPAARKHHERETS